VTVEQIEQLTMAAEQRQREPLPQGEIETPPVALRRGQLIHAGRRLLQSDHQGCYMWDATNGSRIWKSELGMTHLLLQTRLMDVAQDGQSLAAALNHSTLNIANALGAWLGSVVLSAGLGYEWPSRVGAILAVAGVGIAVLSAALGRRSARRS